MINKVLVGGGRDITLHSALGFFRDGACDPAFREQWVEVVPLECFAMLQPTNFWSSKLCLRDCASPKQRQNMSGTCG